MATSDDDSSSIDEPNEPQPNEAIQSMLAEARHDLVVEVISKAREWFLLDKNTAGSALYKWLTLAWCKSTTYAWFK